MKYIAAIFAFALSMSAERSEAAPVQFSYAGTQGAVTASGYMVIDDALFDGSSFQGIFQSNLIDFSMTMTNSTSTFTWGLADLVTASRWFFDSSTAIPDIVGQGGYISNTLSLIAAGRGTMSSSLGYIGEPPYGDWNYEGPVSAVPAPAALPLFLLALGGLGFLYRRKSTV